MDASANEASKEESSTRNILLIDANPAHNESQDENEPETANLTQAHSRMGTASIEQTNDKSSHKNTSQEQEAKRGGASPPAQSRNNFLQ